MPLYTAPSDEGIVNLRRDGRQLFSYQILPFFGLKPTSPIPPEFSGRRMIGNVRVYIYPKVYPGTRKRVLAECPQCKKLVCAGHLHQHLKACR